MCNFWDVYCIIQRSFRYSAVISRSSFLGFSYPSFFLTICCLADRSMSLQIALSCCLFFVYCVLSDLYMIHFYELSASSALRSLSSLHSHSRCTRPCYFKERSALSSFHPKKLTLKLTLLHPHNSFNRLTFSQQYTSIFHRRLTLKERYILASFDHPTFNKHFIPFTSNIAQDMNVMRDGGWSLCCWLIVRLDSKDVGYFKCYIQDAGVQSCSCRQISPSILHVIRTDQV